MLNSVRFLILTCVIIGTTLAQIPVLGRCPNIDVEVNFDVDRFLGRWYEAEKYPFIFSIGGKCITADYTRNTTDPQLLNVVNKQSFKFSPVVNSIEGTARVISNGKLAVKFITSPFVNTESPFWVLGTDYDNFAIVYSCVELGIALNTRAVWILTRARNPETSVLTNAYSILDRKRVTRAYLIRTDQTNCKD